MFERQKYFLAEKAKRHPILWFRIIKWIKLFPFLLPHEKSYYGIKHVIDLNSGLILDVGANNGISAFGLRAIGFKGEILSIEANKYHAKDLSDLKNKDDKFDYKLVAVGKQSSFIKFFIPFYKDTPLHALVGTNLNYIKKALQRDFDKEVIKHIRYDEFQVEQIPLDSLNLNPKFIKLDIEGGELAAIEGMSETLKRSHPKLLIEYTPHYSEPILEKLTQFNYTFHIYDEGQDCLIPFNKESAKTKYHDRGLQVNIFCL